MGGLFRLIRREGGSYLVSDNFPVTSPATLGEEDIVKHSDYHTISFLKLELSLLRNILEETETLFNSCN